MNVFYSITLYMFIIILMYTNNYYSTATTLTQSK